MPIMDGFDVPLGVYNTVNVLRESVQQLSDLITKINHSVQELHLLWVASAAIEYFNRIDAWTSDAQALSKELEELANCLADYIAEWDELEKML